MRHDRLQDTLSITLCLKLEMIDHATRKENRDPTTDELFRYRDIVGELERRRQNKVVSYYKEQLSGYERGRAW